ncbi:MAG: flagellar biosynthesis protein FliQ [Magnetococcales bacterium]|nr:flagellar biosynthesis protein FliQ [Magnetococcales bacterium]MBF0149285.1 flagellar biosynthesis protein FliQ [Magnetococcales bacterium]MBF0172818.1 flagellar biosynthesis protein FliQ [Magnetococcales bacterium]MBF0631617.1 flagellar biosynthesis protein FliQ [Magnetococcales bacterium]
MPTETVLELVIDALKTALIISTPMLLTALVVGIIISLFQSVTQIQEMTLTFIPKILATFLALSLTLPWMLETMMDYFKRLFDSIPGIVN